MFEAELLTCSFVPSTVYDVRVRTAVTVPWASWSTSRMTFPASVPESSPYLTEPGTSPEVISWSDPVSSAALEGGVAANELLGVVHEPTERPAHPDAGTHLR